MTLDRIPTAIVEYNRVVIAVLVVLSAVLGAGAVNLEQSASLERFQKSTDAGANTEYLASNFSTGSANTTRAVIVVRDENVLSKPALVEQLRGERALRRNQTVNESFADGRPPVGIANVIATVALLREDSAELNATARTLADRLNRTRAIQHDYFALNYSRRTGEIDNQTYQHREADIQRRFAAVRQRAARNLTDDQQAEFLALMARVRTLQQRADELKLALRQDEITQEQYLNETKQLEERGGRIYRDIGEEVLWSEYEDLLETRSALRNPGGNTSLPSLSAQIEQVESMNESEVDATIQTVFANRESRRLLAFMPRSYQPGSTTANATLIVVTQRTDGTTLPGTASQRLIREQVELRDATHEAFSSPETFVFGNGLVNEEITQSMIDSLLVLAPLSLLFVILVLAAAYRDPYDIFLGALGILVVLVWTFGAMGWAGFSVSPVFVMAPVLLIGLSIDYANHIFMRYREAGADGDGVSRSMVTALSSLGAALLMVTATTAIGFLANVFSPAPPLQELGLINAFGIVSTLVVFGLFIPALKVELDGFLATREVDRYQQALGKGGGPVGRILELGARAATRSPHIVVAIALLVSAGGVAGAVHVDSSFQQEDFLATDPPAWMEDLPEPFAPGTYQTRDQLQYLDTRFIREDTKVNILVKGDVTDPATLDRVQQAQRQANESEISATFQSGRAGVTSPITVMQAVAAENESFNRTLTAADTDGDGVPDRNVSGVYVALFETAPQRANSVVHRTDAGQYEAVRIAVYVDGTASNERITRELRDVATNLEGPEAAVSLVGQPVLFTQVQEQILDTVVGGLAFSFAVILTFLAIVYRRVHESASLGVVTLLPVLLSVSWIMGTMYVLGIPFNVLTAMIGSITLGLGVDYAIHVSERYQHELDRDTPGAEAIRTSVRGTGGALLGSAVTTAGGFGVLMFALLPPMQQFGLITALTIIYSFISSILVLPSLLVMWTALSRALGYSVRSAPTDQRTRRDEESEPYS
jgi:hydrophobe/amphiphile efflux-3 (HAE3) family protein